MPTVLFSVPPVTTMPFGYNATATFGVAINGMINSMLSPAAQTILANKVTLNPDFTVPDEPTLRGHIIQVIINKQPTEDNLQEFCDSISAFVLAGNMQYGVGSDLVLSRVFSMGFQPKYTLTLYAITPEDSATFRTNTGDYAVVDNNTMGTVEIEGYDVIPASGESASINLDFGIGLSTILSTAIGLTRTAWDSAIGEVKRVFRGDPADYGISSVLTDALILEEVSIALVSTYSIFEPTQEELLATDYKFIALAGASPTP